MPYDGTSVLGDYFSSSRAKGKSGLPLLSVTLNNGVIIRNNLDRRTETNLDPKEHLLIKEGEIAYNMMRMWQGALGRASCEGIVSPAYVILSPKDGVDSLFAEYLFKTPRMVHLFCAYSYGLTKDRLRLYFKDFKRIPVDFPNKKEQQKIAKILSTWDKAINKTQALINTSKQQKKALMQQLLTGKKRFPGFNEKWKRLPLKRIVSINYGKSPKEISNQNGCFYIVGTSGVIGNTNKYLCDKPAVVIGRKGTIDKPLFIEKPFWATDTTFYCLPVDKHIDVKWFYYLAKTINFRKYNEASGVPSLSRETLYNINALAPRLLEQQAIVRMLSLADKEIKILKQKLIFFKQEKKALMQQLLTGNRRVNILESI